MDTGDNLKSYLHQFHKFTNQKINQDTILSAASEMLRTLTNMGLDDYNLDDFSEANLKIYGYEESHYSINKKYKLLSLLCISLLDLGLINMDD